jgi:hypothetical protein
VNYVVSPFLGTGYSASNNEVLNTIVSADGDHCNGIFNFGPATGSGNYIFQYNNVIAPGNACAGGVASWMDGNSGACPSCKGFQFGNVFYNLTGGNIANIGDHSSSNFGTYYIFNNTIDGTNGGCGGGLGGWGGWYAAYEQNQQYIGCSFINYNTIANGGSLIGPCSNGSGSGCNALIVSLASANAQGYYSSSTAAYSPASGCTPSTCATLQSGANLNSPVCSLLNGVNADAYAACQKGGPGGLNYNISNHTVTNGPNYPYNSRPSSGAWDIGAYQFSNSPAPQAPNSLKTTVSPQN